MAKQCRHITNVLAAAGLLLVGCEQVPWLNQPSFPGTSRTARVHDVKIGLTDVTPPELTVGVGDEIRFINDRTNPVRVILVEAGKHVACSRGFRGTMDQEADISPGNSASFCFDAGGTVKYMVRSRAMVGGGEKVLSAQITVQEQQPIASATPSPSELPPTQPTGELTPTQE